jgi:pyrroloquinoline quinone biosynthesis protein B
MGCTKACCTPVLKNTSLKKYATSFALVNPASKQWWLFEATPDIKDQLQLFNTITQNKFSFLPSGIFITHGHTGHYTGLMQLGREAMNTSKLPVYVLPRMQNYLNTNGPWSQLVTLNNIVLNQLKADTSINITTNISVTPFTVPHRDEYTETAGFSINCNSFKTIFIPDIDKWSKFDKSITELVARHNLALLDATFYKDGELPGRPMSEIPHPFVTETMSLFNSLSTADKNKIRFIHLNHTNPLLHLNSQAYNHVKNNGYNVALQTEIITLH